MSYQTNAIRHLAAALFCSLPLFACGGGGGEEVPLVDGNNNPQVLSIDAGDDLGVEELKSVNLYPTIERPAVGIKSYSWSQLSGPPISITTPNSESISFTTPDVSQDETVTLKLTVIDNNGNVVSDIIDILVGNKVLPQGVLKMPVLLNVASSTVGQASITWQPGENMESVETGVSYSLHASKTEGFLAGPETLKKTGVTNLNTTADGFEANQKYYFRIVASNGNDQSISEAISTVISDTEVELLDGITTHTTTNLESVIETTDSGITKINVEDDMKEGDILVDQANGLTFKVESIDTKTGAATLRPAEFGEIFKKIKIESSSAPSLY